MTALTKPTTSRSSSATTIRWRGSFTNSFEDASTIGSSKTSSATLWRTSASVARRSLISTIRFLFIFWYADTQNRRHCLVQTVILEGKGCVAAFQGNTWVKQEQAFIGQGQDRI